MNRRNSGKKHCSCAHNLPFMWISVCWTGSRNQRHENQHPFLISFSSCCDSSAAGCYQLWKKPFSCFCVSNYLMTSWLIWQNKAPAVVMDVTVRERKVPAEKELEQRGWYDEKIDDLFHRTKLLLKSRQLSKYCEIDAEDWLKCVHVFWGQCLYLVLLGFFFFCRRTEYFRKFTQFSPYSKCI